MTLPGGGGKRDKCEGHRDKPFVLFICLLTLKDIVLMKLNLFEEIEEFSKLKKIHMVTRN